MESELDVIDALNALAYTGKCLQVDELTQALGGGGPRNAEFRALVAWLTRELHVLRQTDEQVMSADLDDASEFAMELSALLKELGCPYAKLVEGPLSERYETRAAGMQLLEYLVSELMASKMALRRRRPTQQTYVIAKTETQTARALEQLTRELALGKLPANIGVKPLFDKLIFKAEERQRAVPAGVLSEPLLRPPKQLTEAQWQQLQALQADIDAEYNLRRQMLLTRLEVTVQSFQWSESMRKRENEICERFQAKMNELDALKYGGEDTNLVALLAARTDLSIIEKTSCARERRNTASKIQKHVIGSVPDRGGRANEHAPPPPEMPSWQQQRASGPAGGGRGGGGNFRGGRGGGYGGGRGGGGGGGGGRGGGGGGGGGGRGGGANWQPYSVPQQQSYEQRPQVEQGRDQNWISGGGRVQGVGWKGDSGGGSSGGDGGGGGQGGGGRGGGGGGGGNNYRGHSNYNRGGGGGGGSRR